MARDELKLLSQMLDDLSLDIDRVVRAKHYKTSTRNIPQQKPTFKHKRVLATLRADIENNVPYDSDILRLQKLLDEEIKTFGEKAVAWTIGQADEEAVGAIRQFIYAKAVKGENGAVPKTEEEVRDTAYHKFVSIITGTIPTATEVIN